MNTHKHQIYFDKVDYIKILQQYQDGQLQSASSQETLLVAKAYFIQQFYNQCITVLNQLQHNNQPKILFQRQALLFKAHYLLDYTNINQLHLIIDQFQKSTKFIDTKSFSSYHLNVFKQFRSLIQNQLQNLNSINNSNLNQQIFNRKQQGIDILEKQRQLDNLKKFEGFPCYLIDKHWRHKMLNYYRNKKNKQKRKDKKFRTVQIQIQPTFPGPITNFAIINHIYQIIPYQNKSQSFLNIILFPAKQYDVVSKKQWNFLYQNFKGIPLKRVYRAVTLSRSTNQITFNEKMIIKIAIDFNSKKQIIQTSSTSQWPYSVLPHLWRRYGIGQLKQQNPKNNFRLVGTQKVYETQNNQAFKYVTFQNGNIHELTQEEIKFQTKMFYTFDFQKYDIDQSPSKGLVGLTNDKLMCYMNATLQCLSNTFTLSKYFMFNGHIMYLNFLKLNKAGSRGQITCAFVDIIKKIWTLQSRNQRQAQINPSIFKTVFAKRFQIFMQDSQQDAHQFLNFLLNCLHDDLNKNFKPSSNNVMKNTKDSTNFQEVRRNFFDNYENYNSSIITDLFKGYTYSTLQCLTCNVKFYNFDMHLTIPLPIPASSSAITLSYLSSWNLSKQSIRYLIYLDELETVEDLIRVVSQKLSKQNERKTRKNNVQTKFYLLGLNKSYYKVEHYFENQVKISRLMNIRSKILYYLYEVSSRNQNPFYQSNRKVDIQLDSMDDLQQHNHNQSDYRLTLIEYYFDDQRKGYPKLIQFDQDQQQNQVLALVADGISDQALKYSGAVATQAQKLQCIDKIKIQRSKMKPYQCVLRVKLSKRINLDCSKQKIQQIGQPKNGQLNLQNCFNIFRQKDRILQQEGWICAKCKKVSDCQKQQKIYNVGSHLIIVLKRFKQEQKISTRIQYPVQNLDITKFIDSHYLKNHSNQSFVYDLYGVIVHRGSMNRGHYYSYCKNIYTKKWYLFDDELVRQQDNPNNVVDQNAYILFYKKKQY